MGGNDWTIIIDFSFHINGVETSESVSEASMPLLAFLFCCKWSVIFFYLQPYISYVQKLYGILLLRHQSFTIYKMHKNLQWISVLKQTSIKLKINKCIRSIIYPKHTETNDKHWMTEERWNEVEVFWLNISVQANEERHWLQLVEIKQALSLSL